jgi:choline dehydrogenase-like flavoprotein
MGHFLMDHHLRVGAQGLYKGFMDEYYSGRRPNSLYIPRFRNLNAATARTDYLRGFAYQGSATREGWNEQSGMLPGFGPDFKNQLTAPGPWRMWMGSWGETLPYAENKIALSADKKDRWGLPVVEIDFSFQSNEQHMRKDSQQCAAEMLESSGFTDVSEFDYHAPGGTAVHEMGTMRMGHDPRTSLLNSQNQLHDVRNLFVTDGSCMTSSACQNPSLTYMALTARACDFAVGELKKGNI